ncbi:MAG: MFS transporter [Betaproteobacteria bacterium]|nr:MFS transporter [Betaproteobacteria bacterium]
MPSLPYWRLAGVYFFHFAYIGAFAPYFSLYLNALGITAAGIGVIMALPQLVRIFAPHLWGWFADRSGRRLRIARIGTVIGTVIYCGLFAARGFEALFAIVLLMSFFLSAALPLIEVTTLTHLGEHTAQYGRIRVWGSIGFIAAVLAVGYALDWLPIGVLLWIMLAILLGAATLLLLVPEAPHAEHTHEHMPIAHVIRQPQVVALIVACALMAVAHGPYYTFYSIYLVDYGYSKGAIGWLWALGVICEIAIFFWMSHLFRAFALRQVLIASFGLASLRFLIIAWCAESLLLLVFAQALHAASFGSFHAAALGYVHRFFRGRHQARGQAIYTSLTFGLGGTLGGLYSGASWATLGPALTFTIAAGCALIGMVILWSKLKIGER